MPAGQGDFTGLTFGGATGDSTWPWLPEQLDAAIAKTNKDLEVVNVARRKDAAVHRGYTKPFFENHRIQKIMSQSGESQ